ncbi:hypothetical protein ACWD4V_19535 [Streptomyces tsukubensis]
MTMPGFTAAPYAADGYGSDTTYCRKECHARCWDKCQHKYDPAACTKACMDPCVEECEYTPYCWEQRYCDENGTTMSQRHCKEYDGSVTVYPPERVSTTCDV